MWDSCGKYVVPMWEQRGNNMQIIDENEIVLPERIAHYEPDPLQIVEVNVHEHFNENVGSVHNQPQQLNIITRSEASAEEQISDLPYIESESEDAGILNYIRNFLMDDTKSRCLQISDLPYIESESEDAGILNYIRNFLMDEYEQNIPISNRH
ncbi:hypothetical protein TSAR_016504, partial [Trichomalopsis sarcophagae]